MADSATTSLRLRKQTLASNVNVWGDPYLNTNFDLLDDAINGVTAVALGTATATTFTSTNYAADQARNPVYVLSGTGTQTTTITLPSANVKKLVVNNSSGVALFKTAAGTGVAVDAGQRAWIYSDGTQFQRGDPTLDKVRAPTASLAMNSQRITGLAAGTASSDAMRVGEAQTYVDTASAWANTTGSAVTGTLYSARAWAIGGSGQPPGGAASAWATALGSSVDGTGYSAKEWAAGTGADVDGTYKSARLYAVDGSAQAGTASGWASTASGWNSTASGWAGTASGWNSTASGWASTASGWSSTASGWSGTASAWANTTGSAVTGTLYSGQAWAIGGSGAPPGGAAKQWAEYEAGAVDGTGYSAKRWATDTAVITGGLKGARGYALDAAGSTGRHYGTGTGTDTITAALTPAMTAYAVNQVVRLVAEAPNTGAVVVNFDSLGAKDLVDASGSALTGAGYEASQLLEMTYDGTSFRLAGGGGASSSISAGKVAFYTFGGV